MRNRWENSLLYDKIMINDRFEYGGEKYHGYDRKITR